MSIKERTADNTHLLIKKDKEGNLKRVWVQQKVKYPETLISLQDQIASVNPDFKPEYVPGLHLTLVHFGKPSELYMDFKRVKPDLAFDEFMDEFYQLLQKCDTAVNEETVVDVENLGILGQAVVLMIAKTPELMGKRQVVSKALRQFVQELGVVDVDQLMLQSPNLQHQLDEVYTPHITLGHIGRDSSLPQVDISEMKITLRPSDIGGVDK